MFRLRRAKCYGIFPLVLSAELLASIHGDAERIPVDQFETGIRIFYKSLIEVAADSRGFFYRPYVLRIS